MVVQFYRLRQRLVNRSLTIDGSGVIHDAVVKKTIDPDIAEVIMETTAEEDSQLSTLAISSREANNEEVASLRGLFPPFTPDTHTLLGSEIKKAKAKLDEYLALQPADWTQAKALEVIKFQLQVLERIVRYLL